MSPTRRHSASGTRRRGDRGSIAVEFVLLTPVLMMFLLLVVACGRYVAVKGDIEATARDAARAASLERDAGSARAVAQDFVRGSLDGTDCAPAVVGGTWAPGGEVTVRLNCSVSYSGLGLIGLPGRVAVVGESDAPLDFYKDFE